jgi:transposase InsO family protein|tara:strand:+ start:261 stop:1112 length:852 start_codon:yes stop_codon:yes gene_type:complete
MVTHIQRRFPFLSQRRACKILGQPRSTQRHHKEVSDFESRLVQRIVDLAKAYGRYGYRQITAILRREGWRVNHKRIERIWRQEGLKIPSRQPKRKRLWLNDGSCMRLRADRPNHVWSYDFVLDRSHDGRPIRLLPIIDEFTRECFTIEVGRKLRSDDVLSALTNIFTTRGTPQYIRSDNGSEFTAKAVRDWLSRVGVKTLFIEPGSPWENGYIESFNGKLRYELLNCEIFETMHEAKVLIEDWRLEYNTFRPHSSLGYRPPAPEVIRPAQAVPAMPPLPVSIN